MSTFNSTNNKSDSNLLLQNPPFTIFDIHDNRKSSKFRSFNIHQITSKFLISFLSAPVILIMTCLIFSLFYSLPPLSGDFQRSSAVLSSVSSIMRQHPIVDLQITKGNCSLSYEQVSLGEWTGMTHGCLYKEKNTVKSGNCDQTEKGIGIQAIKNQVVNQWKNHKFCVQRSSYKLVEPGKDCITDYVKCGETLCVEGEKCPITNIQGIKIDTLNEESFITSDLHNHYDLQLERSSEKEPLVGFSISYNSIPCLETNAAPFSEGFESYPLINIKKGCHYNQNLETIKIDSQSLTELANDLDNSEKILSLPNINNYSSPDSINLIGLYRFQVKTEPKCLTSNQFETIGRAPESVDQINSIKNTYIVTMIFVMAITGSLIFDLKLTQKKNFSSTFKDNKTKQIILLVCGLVFLSSFVLYWISSPKIQEMTGFRNALNKQIQKDCFINDSINKAMKDFVDGPMANAQLFSYLLIFITGVILIPIFVLFFERLQKRSEDNQSLISTQKE